MSERHAAVNIGLYFRVFEIPWRKNDRSCALKNTTSADKTAIATAGQKPQSFKLFKTNYMVGL